MNLIAPAVAKQRAMLETNLVSGLIDNVVIGQVVGNDRAFVARRQVAELVFPTACLGWSGALA